jgi:S-adenosylmethionine synthetase
MGRIPGTVTLDGKTYETFTWEKLDFVDKLRKEFKIEAKKELADA